jgi:hypothetical protein
VLDDHSRFLITLAACANQTGDAKVAKRFTSESVLAAWPFKCASGWLMVRECAYHCRAFFFALSTVQI